MQKHNINSTQTDQLALKPTVLALPRPPQDDTRVSLTTVVTGRVCREPSDWALSISGHFANDRHSVRPTKRAVRITDSVPRAATWKRLINIDKEQVRRVCCADTNRHGNPLNFQCKTQNKSIPRLLTLPMYLTIMTQHLLTWHFEDSTDMDSWWARQWEERPQRQPMCEIHYNFEIRSKKFKHMHLKRTNCVYKMQFSWWQSVTLRRRIRKWGKRWTRS